MKTLFLAAISVVIAACGQSETDKLSAQRDSEDRAASIAEAKLLSDPALAEAEIKRRVHDAVEVNGRLVVVKSFYGLQTAIFPLSVPWELDCDGINLKLVFGSMTDVTQGDSINLGLIYLTYPGITPPESVPREQCRALALVAGREVVQILSPTDDPRSRP